MPPRDIPSKGIVARLHSRVNGLALWSRRTDVQLAIYVLFRNPKRPMQAAAAARGLPLQGRYSERGSSRGKANPSSQRQTRKSDGPTRRTREQAAHVDNRIGAGGGDDRSRGASAAHRYDSYL